MKKNLPHLSIKTFLFYLIVISLSLGILGCTTTPAKPDWIDHPAAHSLAKKHTVVVGSATLLPGVPESEIRKDAEVDGRKKLAAFLGLKIQSIALDYSRIEGDIKKNTVVSTVESQEFRQIVIQQTVRFSFVQEFYSDQENKTLYCLMTLEKKNFRQNFLHQVDRTLEKQQIPSQERKKAINSLRDIVSKK
jgi:uncharacterized membrane-anchored protein YitT (DUF2179 family)